LNYLGHIYFSNNDLRLAKANLFGDSVKGKNYTDLPEFIQKGVKLHREIDDYIDHHPSVVQLIRTIREDLPKVAPIAVDLYFDHLLAKNWSNFHPTPLEQFLENVHSTIHRIDREFYPAGFNEFMDKLCLHKWMTAYDSLYGLDKMCNGVSKRISFENSLPKGLSVFLTFQTPIEQAFNEYMRDANEHFLKLF